MKPELFGQKENKYFVLKSKNLNNELKFCEDVHFDIYFLYIQIRFIGFND